MLCSFLILGREAKIAAALPPRDFSFSRAGGLGFCILILSWSTLLSIFTRLRPSRGKKKAEPFRERPPMTGKRRLTRQEELELVRRAQRKDGKDSKEARGVLYEHFFLAVKGCIAGRIGNTMDAEDLVQDTFLDALRQLQDGKYDEQYRFFTFLRLVAKNTVRKGWRRSVREIPADDPEETAGGRENGEGSGEPAGVTEGPLPLAVLMPLEVGDLRVEAFRRPEAADWLLAEFEEIGPGSYLLLLEDSSASGEGLPRRD